MIKIVTILAAALFCITSLHSSAAPSNPKYAKWQNPSYFRGYNILYDTRKTQQDINDFKNYGGNLLMIGIRGFLGEDAPYDTVQSSISGTDVMVDFCRTAGVHYVIAVRSGPGAYDTYLESSQQTGESRIWNDGNTAEQQLYANMLKMIVQRYAGDTLFAGINLVVEPRPKVRQVPANTSSLYKRLLEQYFNIHMDRVYNYLVSSVREADPKLPIILENFAYSTPELFPPYDITGEYLVYSAHNYQPVEFSKAQAPFTASYPGTYWNITYLSQVRFDSAFVRNTLFAKVRQYQQSSNMPIFLGEFGMFLPQIGGDRYINDVLKTCKDYGWHFALWDWRRRSGQNWDIEGFTDTLHQHWKSVLQNFNAPPVPGLIFPGDGTMVSNLMPEFIWDSLTSYTKYDIRIQDPAGNGFKLFSDITNAHWQYSGEPLAAGRTYYWCIRSKNPGGTEANNSAWSGLRSFKTPSLTALGTGNTVPQVFKLHQNYPNPFNPSTKIEFEIPEFTNNGYGVNVYLSVYNTLGKEIAVLVNQILQPGVYTFKWHASDNPSGVYFYKLKAGGFTENKKMVLLK